MLTVPEAARRAGRNPKTIRRWIREGKLPARKIGTQHVLDEEDLEAMLDRGRNTLALPPEWTETFWGGPMPDWTSIVRRQRDEHRAVPGSSLMRAPRFTSHRRSARRPGSTTST